MKYRCLKQLCIQNCNGPTKIRKHLESMGSSTQDKTSRMKHQLPRSCFIFYRRTLAPPAGQSKFAALHSILKQNSSRK